MRGRVSANQGKDENARIKIVEVPDAQRRCEAARGDSAILIFAL